MSTLLAPSLLHQLDQAFLRRKALSQSISRDYAAGIDPFLQNGFVFASPYDADWKWESTDFLEGKEGHDLISTPFVKTSKPPAALIAAADHPRLHRGSAATDTREEVLLENLSCFIPGGLPLAGIFIVNESKSDADAERALQLTLSRIMEPEEQKRIVRQLQAFSGASESPEQILLLWASRQEHSGSTRFEQAQCSCFFDVIRLVQVSLRAPTTKETPIVLPRLHLRFGQPLPVNIPADICINGIPFCNSSLSPLFAGGPNLAQRIEANRQTIPPDSTADVTLGNVFVADGRLLHITSECQTSQIAPPHAPPTTITIRFKISDPNDAKRLESDCNVVCFQFTESGVSVTFPREIRSLSLSALPVECLNHSHKLPTFALASAAPLDSSLTIAAEMQCGSASQVGVAAEGRESKVEGPHLHVQLIVPFLPASSSARILGCLAQRLWRVFKMVSGEMQQLSGAGTEEKKDLYTIAIETFRLPIAYVPFDVAVPIVYSSSQAREPSILCMDYVDALLLPPDLLQPQSRFYHAYLPSVRCILQALHSASSAATLPQRVLYWLSRRRLHTGGLIRWLQSQSNYEGADFTAREPNTAPSPLSHAVACSFYSVIECARQEVSDTCKGRGSKLLDVSGYKPINVHLKVEIPEAVKSAPEPNSSWLVAVARGLVDYAHYRQENYEDQGWGCAYRTLQTIVAWYWNHGFISSASDRSKFQRFLTIDEVQQELILLGETTREQLDRNPWISAVEASLVLRSKFRIDSRIIPIFSQAQCVANLRKLVRHFREIGSPVLLAGNLRAMGILGVCMNKDSGEGYLLLLDPHYRGRDDLDEILNKDFDLRAGKRLPRWCSWRSVTEAIQPDTSYSILLPLHPPSSNP